MTTVGNQEDRGTQAKLLCGSNANGLQEHSTRGYSSGKQVFHASYFEMQASAWNTLLLPTLMQDIS